MFDGAILRQGTPEELANDPIVRKLYLGEKFRLRESDDVERNA
jgi:ABC-type (unclassified) transport system, ATPase component